MQKKVVPFAATPGATFASWLAVLEELSSLQPALVIPTHSPVGDGSLISEEIAFITDMRDRMASSKSSGLSVEDASARLCEAFEKSYPEWAANPDWPNMATAVWHRWPREAPLRGSLDRQRLGRLKFLVE